jgi:hypothetical protein
LAERLGSNGETDDRGQGSGDRRRGQGPSGSELARGLNEIATFGGNWL